MQKQARFAASRRWKGADLAPGAILEIARKAGIRVPDSGAKRPIECPFHDDTRPSAFLSERNVFYCSVCTPSKGWSARTFAEALRVDWNPQRDRPRGAANRRRERRKPVFTPLRAQEVWERARVRALDDDKVELDRAVYDYLIERGLDESWELRLFGTINVGMELPEEIAWWPASGYRLLVPAYDRTGVVTNVQARAVVPVDRKVLFPPGSNAKGTLFADRRGLDLLRGERGGARVVVLGEGLTDMLALAVASPHPVLAIPGTGAATSSIDSWVRGMTVCLAFDRDGPGEDATSAAAKVAYGLGAERVRRAIWPEGCNDACDTLRALGASGMADLLAGGGRHE